MADTIGISRKRVSEITSAFVQELKKALVDDGEVYIEGFGRFRVASYKGGKRVELNIGTFKKGQRRGRILVDVHQGIKVYFSKAPTFAKQLDERYITKGRSVMVNDNEEGMDKLGVDEGVSQEELEKRANAGCPKCGRKPDVHGNVLVCPVDGTEPFESK